MTTASVEMPEYAGMLFDPPLGEQVRTRGFYGGRGGGKSWTVAGALLIHGVQHPLRVLCAREFMASIRESVHHLLADQIVTLGLQSSYNVGQYTITGSNGTEFIFHGLRRNIGEIKSTEGIQICWVEEAEAVSRDSWTKLIPTIRTAPAEIWLTFNPDQPDGETYQRFVVNTPRDALIRKVGWEDNPWFPESLRLDKDADYATDPELAAHVWGGEPWARSNAAVMIGKWVVDEFTPEADWEGPYFGIDWGFSNDPTAMTKAWVHKGDLYIEAEAGGRQWDNDRTAAAMKAFSAPHDAGFFADNARPETINEMRLRGVRCLPAPKWSGSVLDGINHLRSYGRVVIHPRCKEIHQEARLWRHKVDKSTGEPLRDLVDGNDHYFDSLRYGLASRIKQRTARTVRVAYA